MNYYKMRTEILHRIKGYLGARQEAVAQKLDPPPFLKFQDSLILEYGITPKMVKGMVEYLTKGGTIKDGEIVKKETEE